MKLGKGGTQSFSPKHWILGGKGDHENMWGYSFEREPSWGGLALGEITTRYVPDSIYITIDNFYVIYITFKFGRGGLGGIALLAEGNLCHKFRPFNP